MGLYDLSSPAQGHVALTDVEQIRSNCNALRENEASASTSPPSNPVGGQFWWASDTKAMYQRKADNSGWSVALWYETDPPARTSDFNSHTGSNITSSVVVHGIKQGSGNGLDADLLDGQHASSFLGSSHATATSGVHGAGSGVLLSAPTTTPFLIIASTAPAGWTQVTSWNDKVIRVVSGAGAGTGGSWTISGISHTHSISSDGSHAHTLYRDGWGSAAYNTQSGRLSTSGGSGGSADRAATQDISSSTASTHNHSGATGAGGASDGSWRPAYIDCIAVTKNA